MDIHNFHRGVVFQVTAQFGDIHVHATGGEIAVVLPDFVEGRGSVHHLVEIEAEQEILASRRAGVVNEQISDPVDDILFPGMAEKKKIQSEESTESSIYFAREEAAKD